MDEISNKTLATLLVVAIVISLAGTFFAMRGVSQITNIVTGAASSATGTAKVNITETVDITLRNNTVDFGNGYRNNTVVNANTECNLSSNDSAIPTCWIMSTGSYGPVPFLLENTGNVHVNITINSSTAASFISGTVIGGTRRYGWRPEAPFTGRAGCDNLASDMDESLYTDFLATPQLLCANLSPSDDDDRIRIDINVSIPAGPTGDKSADVIFQALKNY